MAWISTGATLYSCGGAAVNVFLSGQLFVPSAWKLQMGTFNWRNLVQFAAISARAAGGGGVMLGVKWAAAFDDLLRVRAKTVSSDA